MWSLSNAFTSAFKNLDPIPQFQGHGKLKSHAGPCFIDPTSCRREGRSTRN
jgi:hypothetical protein